MIENCALAHILGQWQGARGPVKVHTKKTHFFTTFPKAKTLAKMDFPTYQNASFTDNKYQNMTKSCSATVVILG